LPFGSATISIQNTQGTKHGKEGESPQYIASPTTNTDFEELFFDGNNNFGVPQTTSGI